jgi:hypothetical protein
MTDSITPHSLEEALAPLDPQVRDLVMLEVQNTFQFPPPILRTTAVGDTGGFVLDWSSVSYYNDRLSIEKIDTMMRSGQIAYPMAMKKAPAISIVSSESGFKVTSPDEPLAQMVHANLRELLPRCIDEILTFQEYGAFYGEVTYEPAWPQDYGLTKSPIPWWAIADLHACHPSTINKILRDQKTRAFRGFEQAVTWRAEPVIVGLDRALVISNNGQFGNIEGQSVLESVHVWWFWYELIWRALLRYLQRTGDGMVIVKAPSRGKVVVNGRAVDAMDWALQIANSIGKTNRAVMPSDVHRDTNKELWQVEFVKTGDEQAGKSFTEALTHLGDNINRFLLTGDPAGEGDEFSIMLDTERMLGQIATHLNRYVLRRVLKYNGSAAAKLALEFQGANSRILPLLFKLMAVAGNTAGDALQNVNWRELFEKGGVPVLTEDEVEEKREQAKKEAMEISQGQFGQPPGSPPKLGGPPKPGDAKAKGQPDGSGRWASQRDKEGKPEKLEITQEEVDFAQRQYELAREVASLTPAVHLSVEQVAGLHAIGVLADDRPVTLANPYHDKGGRFTSRNLAVMPMPDDLWPAPRTAKARTQPARHRTAIKPPTVTLYGQDEFWSSADVAKFSQVFGQAVEMAGGIRAGIDVAVGNRAFAENVCSGADTDEGRAECMASVEKSSTHYDPLSNRMLVDPLVVSDMMAAEEGTLEYQQVQRTLVHELIHSRPRDVDIDIYGVQYNRHTTTVFFEEGCTDLLAVHAVGGHVQENAKTLPGYIQYMGAIAILVAGVSGWDTDLAWSIVDTVHMSVGDWNTILQLIADFTGTSVDDWDESSVWAFLEAMMDVAEADGYNALGWLMGTEDKKEEVVPPGPESV